MKSAARTGQFELELFVAMAERIETAEISSSLGSRVLDSLKRFFDGDIFYSFKRSPLTIAAVLTSAIVSSTRATSPTVTV